MSEKDYLVETLDPKDFDEWVEHCASVFGFEYAAEYFRRHYMSDPYRENKSIFIIKDDGKIVSTVRVFHRQVYLGGKIYKMGGIGEVSTNKNYRRLGLSYKLMAAATEYMLENNFILSMLGTGYFGHYEKHGFRQVNLYTKTVSADLNIDAPDIRLLTADNYNEMSELYNKYCSSLNCCMVRTSEYWQEWCAAEMDEPHGLFIDNKLAGYICFDGDWVNELVADDNLHDILLSHVKPEKGKLKMPAFINTGRKFYKQETHSDKMICLYKPVEIDGVTLNDTEQLVDYLNSHGGIVQWGHDGF